MDDGRPRSVIAAGDSTAEAMEIVTQEKMIFAVSCTVDSESRNNLCSRLTVLREHEGLAIKIYNISIRRRGASFPGVVIAALIAVALCGRLMAEEDTSSIKLRESCVDAQCHANYSQSPSVHSPVLLKQCGICHETLENRHKFRLVTDGSQLCALCHKMKLKSVVHEPVAKGECLKCHDSHSSAFPYLLKADKGRQLCIDCHKDDGPFADVRYAHAPSAQGACVLCHEVHSSWNEKLLLIEGNTLCLSCHKKEFQQQLELRHIHLPVMENCQKCHNPHGSNTPMLLSKDEPEFCYDCHPQIAQIIRTSSRVHEATIMGKRCSNCHTAHASPLPKLLAGPMYDICLSCHDKEVKGQDGVLLQNIAALMAENPFRHGPIQQNNCIACHNPHGSSIFRLLVSYFPEDFYAPFDLKEYNLCFQCHPKDTFLQERTTALTNFRDGDLNLHFLHVNKEQKGRTCRACHEVHASKQKAHVRSVVPYGNWEFPLVFEADENGGTCAAGCHDAKTYTRKYEKIETANTSASDQNVGAAQEMGR